MAVHYSSNRTFIKETGDEDTENRMESVGSVEIKDLCQTLSKAFDMSNLTANVSHKFLKEDDQDLVWKARSPVDRPLRKPYWQSERRL